MFLRSSQAIESLFAVTEPNSLYTTPSTTTRHVSAHEDATFKFIQAGVVNLFRGQVKVTQLTMTASALYVRMDRNQFPTSVSTLAVTLTPNVVNGLKLTFVEGLKCYLTIQLVNTLLQLFAY